MQALLSELQTEIVRHCEASLHAILLSGSLGRGEAIAIELAGGGWTLLSDIDLYVVTAQEPTAELRAVLAQRLREAPFLCAGADVAFVRPDHFGRLGSTLPAAQLRHALKVLYEGPLKWNLEPSAPPQIDADDALALIQNRAGELIFVRQTNQSPQHALLECYRELRLAMDGVLALLAAGSGYEPDRARREERFELLLRESEVGAEFAATWQSLSTLHRRAVQGAMSELELRAAFAASHVESAHRRWTRLLYAAMLARFSDPREDAKTALSRGAAMPQAQRLELTRRWLTRRGRFGTWREARRWAPLAPSANRSWARYAAGGSGPERIRAACVEFTCGGGAAAAAAIAKPTFGRGLRQAPLESALAQLWAEWMLGGRRL